MAEITKLVEDFETFLQVTQSSRTNAERDQDYIDHKQWTEDEANKLKERNQPPVVINRIKTKVNLLNGVQRQRRTDPKALPRTPKHEDGADAVTDALRFVGDNVDFQQTSSEVFNDLLVCYGAAITEVGDDNGEMEIQVNRIPWDRFYYDPHSRARDFSDAKFKGVVIWMDKDDAQTAFPGKKTEIDNLLNHTTGSVDGSTFDDKPTWIDVKNKRIRVCQHYYKEKGVWHVAYFSDQVFLIDSKPSNYLDEFGHPDCPIEAECLYVDRENNRYGEIRGYIWIQDEINHRRSKLLHQLSVRQTLGEDGAVDDVNAMKKELARADGHVKINPGLRFELLNTNDQAAGQLSLYQESKSEIDSVGANAALSGGEGTSNLSGRAIQSLQQGGMAELGALFDTHKAWERRIYRQIWNRIKQFWDAEKWIRVTDNEDNLKWVGLNQKLSKGDMLLERAQAGDENSKLMLNEFIDDPRMQEPGEVRNNVAEIDVDIIIAESPDYAVLRQEQFDTLARLAEAYGPEAVPFEVMLELSDMSHKKQVKDMLKGDEDPEKVKAQAQLQGMQAKEQFDGLKLANVKTRSEIGKNIADLEQKQAETEKLRTQPVDSVTVAT